MAAKSNKRATYADLERLPSNVVGEILFGILHVTPRPGLSHTWVASALGSDLLQLFERGRGGPGGWIILDEPELHLGSEPDVLVPDIAGWRRERLTVVPDEPFMKLAPDWVCEVVSPSTEVADRRDKMEIYARERVRYAWLVDPAQRSVEVFRLDGQEWRTLNVWSGDAKVRAEPFDAVEIDLAMLWERLPPKK